MSKLKLLSMLLAGGVFAGGIASTASAQPWMDRDRDWRDRQEWRDNDWRGRGYGWGRREHWREHERNCYYTRREFRDRYGDLVVRRYRVCED